MTSVVKFTHLEQTSFVYSYQLFHSLMKCLDLSLWRKERNISTSTRIACSTPLHVPDGMRLALKQYNDDEKVLL